MRKIMKRKSRTPNSETSYAKDDDRSDDENNTSQDQDSEDPVNESPNKRSKKNKRQSKNADENDDENNTSQDHDSEDPSKKSKKKGRQSKVAEENGTDKKSKKSKEVAEEEDEEEEQYEVEQILDEKMVRGARHYLIRWKGYKEDSDTWEPESTLNCPERMAEYQSNKGQTGKRSSKHKESKKKKRDANDEENDENSEADENVVYEVDKIIEVHHKRNGQREFLVHWKGYSQAENTWEPEENMNCPDLINRFMAKVELARLTDTRELRVKREPTERFTLSMVSKGRRLSKRNQGRQRVQYYDAE